jgi:hypothetical protein
MLINYHLNTKRNAPQPRLRGRGKVKQKMINTLDEKLNTYLPANN